MPKIIALPCDELRHLYEHERATTIQLSARYGCSVTTIAKRLHACGVPLRNAQFQTRAIPREELERLYGDEGATVAEIARHFGVTASTIYNRLHAYGLPLRRPRKTRGYG